MTMTADHSRFDATDRRQTSNQMPVAVQVLSTILFAAFVIPVTIVALNVFWPAGVVIAIILAWRGGFAPTGTPSAPPRDVEEAVKSLVPTAAQKEARSSGNASFDAYRNDMLDRLEVEQHNFEGFLSRLRDAKDQSEFDTFLDERAAQADD